MIKAEKLSFSFPQKDLYHEISFTIEDKQHCAFIGTNGTGKSTLIDMIRDPEKHLFDGKLKVEPGCRIGYVSQFFDVDRSSQVTVFEYLSEPFVKLQNEITRICDAMGTVEDLEPLMEEYQTLMDQSDAVDGDNYESNVRKQLKTAGLEKKESQHMASLSGGEYKLIMIMKEMLWQPQLLIMDEPDGFLDFENLNALKALINSHKGTMLVVTHNRYLLNHCFNKILHLENKELQEFDGSYAEYNYALLLKKIELQEAAAADEAEIERNRKVVERMRTAATNVDSATRGRSLGARVSFLERLEARKIKAPFVEISQPAIMLHTEQPGACESILRVQDYAIHYDEALLEQVSFEVGPTDKVAIVGANGTGKTTMLQEIYRYALAAQAVHTVHHAITLDETADCALLSQLPGEVLTESNTVLQEFEALGFENEASVRAYLSDYCFDEEMLYSKLGTLSGGEKNVIQLAKIAAGDANLLFLDEPSSHLDLYAQLALEKALAEYNGAVLMVSHDFYTIANCMDYVLWVEDQTVRRMSIRRFRKMIYARYFDKNYLEIEQKKKEMETKVSRALEAKDYEGARVLAEKLGEFVG